MSETKNKSGWKVVLIVIGVAFLLFCGVVCYFVVNDLKQEDILKQEIVNYSHKDLATDNFEIKIKTTGDYAYVEEAIKLYYKSLSDIVKNINKELKNEKYLTMFSFESLSKERPLFKESREVVQKTKLVINEEIEEFSRLASEKTIDSLLDKNKIDQDEYDYYYDFYKDLMYSNISKKEFEELRAKINKLGNMFNDYLDLMDELFVFLGNNDSNISYKENKLFFQTKELYLQYTEYVTKLEQVRESFLSISGKDEKTITEDVPFA